MRSRGLPSSADAAGRAAWARRVVIGGLGTAGATIALAAFAASAFANAANPLPPSVGQPLQDVPGGVLVQLSGTWSWGELGPAGTKTSPQNDCSGRYGVGWSVDWWGINNSKSPDSGKGPTTASTVSIADKNNPPTNIGQQSASVGGTWQVKQTGQFFHTTAQYNGFEADLCPTNNPDITLDKNGAPMGSWSASAVYPSRSAIPAQVCVNFYDPHGTEGKWSTSSGDLLASADSDNSIKTNDFNPAQPQYCFSPTPDKVSINVVKDNNAGGGAFADTNTAGSSDENVTFRVGIVNKSTVPVTVSSVTDSIVNGANVPNVTCTLTNNPNATDTVIGKVIPVDGSTTCYFTVPKYLTNYLPNGQSAATDDVVVKVTSTAGNAQNDDTSVVKAPNPKPTLAAFYRLCTDNSVVTGGSFHTPIGDVNNKLDPTPLDPGTYTVSTKTVPDGYVLVACPSRNTSRHTFNTPKTTQTSTIGPDDELDFYLAPAPGLHVTKDGPVSGVVGGTGDYTITVTNTSNQADFGGPVVFYDQLPTGETFLSAQQVKANGDPINPSQITCAPVTGNTSLVKCTYGNNLAAGESIHVDVTIQWANDVEGKALTDCAGTSQQNAQPGTAAADACVTTHFPELGVQKTGPAVGALNGNGTYTLLVTNNTAVASTQQPVTDTLPDGEKFVASASSPACSAVGQIVSCTVPALAGHGSTSFTVTVTYTKTGALTDCATIDGQPVPSCKTTIVDQPSISVVKTNDADGDGTFHDTEQAKQAGDPVTFKVVVTNTSKVTVVIDSVSDAFDATTQAECPRLLNTVLAAGDSVTCTFTVDNYAPPAGESLTDTVTVGGHEPTGGTPVTGSDTSTVTTKKAPTPGPDLAIVKTADQDKVKAGDTLTYTLSVSNVGDGPTTGTVAVFDTVPSGLDLVSVDGGSLWDCSNIGRDITCDYNGGVVNPGDVLPDITIVTTVNSTASVRVVNTGVVSTPGDTNPDNNRSTVKTPVTQVLGEKVTQPKTPTTVLPFTGDRTGQLLPVGLLAVILGMLLMVTGRRRRRYTV